MVGPTEQTAGTRGGSERAEAPRSSGRVELLAGSDQRYFPGLAVAVLSTLKSLDKEVSCRFTVVDGGISDESRAFLHDAFSRLARVRAGGSALEFTEVDMSRFDELPKIWGYSTMTYSRILAPNLVDADHVIWVDADMIVFKDLSEITRMLGTGNVLLAGVQDPYQTMETDSPVDVSDSRDQSYINCGLLWMNLKRMREDGFTDHLMEKMQEWKDALKYWDQTALNCATLGDKHVLPRSYNELVRHQGASDLVSLVGQANIHLITADKPWMEPDPYEQGVRDIIFHKVFGRLTGVVPEKRIAEISRSFRLPIQCMSGRFWKKAFYFMTGNVKRYRKWKERALSERTFRRLTATIDRQLEAWYER